LEASAHNPGSADARRGRARRPGGAAALAQRLGEAFALAARFAKQNECMAAAVTHHVGGRTHIS